jgi:hypothetical protein
MGMFSAGRHEVWYKHMQVNVYIQGAKRPSGAWRLVWLLQVDAVHQLSTALSIAMLRVADPTDRGLPIHERSCTKYL